MCAEWMMVTDSRGSIVRTVVNDIDAQAAVLALFVAGFIGAALVAVLRHVHLAMLRHVGTGLRSFSDLGRHRIHGSIQLHGGRGEAGRAEEQRQP